MKETNVEALFNLIKATTQRLFQKMPGHISTSLHLSHDRSNIATYVQWATVSDFYNMAEHPDVQSFLDDVSELALSVNTTTYNHIWCT